MSETVTLEPLPHPGESPTLTGSQEVERGVEFETGDLFRRESAVQPRPWHPHRRPSLAAASAFSMPCAVAASALSPTSPGGAAIVWTNDVFDGCRGLIPSNLSREARVSLEGERRCVVMHWNANKVPVECHLHRNNFDLANIDPFGSESLFTRPAIAALKIGGGFFTSLRLLMIRRARTGLIAECRTIG